jgi:hypothetical protein
MGSQDVFYLQVMTRASLLSGEGGFEPPIRSYPYNGLANRHAPSRKPLTRQGVKDSSKSALPLPCPTDAPALPPDLAELMAVWPTLPASIKSWVLKVVNDVSRGPEDR